MKKIFTFCSALLCAAVAFSQTSINVTGETANSVIEVTEDATITGTATDVQILIKADVTVTLNDLTLKTSPANTVGSPVRLDTSTYTKATIVLEGTNLIDARPDAEETIGLAGIEVNDSTEIEVKGDGKLTVFGSGNSSNQGGLWTKNPAGAGIGSRGYNDSINSAPESKAGKITISGGTIYALGGGHNAASIGGGYKGDVDSIFITGGLIIAEAIGNGSGGVFGHIEITGGTIYAQWSLGCWASPSTSTINISGDAIVYAHTWGDINGEPTVEIEEGSNTLILGNEAPYDVLTVSTDYNEKTFVDKLTFNNAAETVTIPAGRTLVVPAEITIDADYAPIVGNYEGNIINVGEEVAIPTVGAASSKIYAANGVLYAADATSVTVRSLSGQIVLKSVKSEINIDALPQGVYVVQATTPAGINTAKIVNK